MDEMKIEKRPRIEKKKKKKHTHKKKKNNQKPNKRIEKGRER